jgi:hypothetical protein
VLKAFCFLLLKTDPQANPWIFFTVHSHELMPVKILEFYPAHFNILVTNGLNGVLCPKIEKTAHLRGKNLFFF